MFQLWCPFFGIGNGLTGRRQNVRRSGDCSLISLKAEPKQKVQSGRKSEITIKKGVTNFNKEPHTKKMVKKILWPFHSIYCMDMDSAIYWALFVLSVCRLCAFIYVPDLSCCHFDCHQPETYLYFYYNTSDIHNIVWCAQMKYGNICITIISCYVLHGMCISSQE